MMTRTEVLRRLRQNADAIRLRLQVWSLDEWEGPAFDPPVEMAPFIRVGWTPPRDEVVELVADVCPELIALQMNGAGLDNVECDAYVRAINFLICVYQTNKDLPLDERIRLVESTLYNVNPATLQLVSRVQMQGV